VFFTLQKYCYEKKLPLLVFRVPLLSRAQIGSTKADDIVTTFAFNHDEDKTVNLADYKGKIVVLNFGVIWCGPRRMELLRL
jgi:hypothetical protein